MRRVLVIVGVGLGAALVGLGLARSVPAETTEDRESESLSMSSVAEPPGPMRSLPPTVPEAPPPPTRAEDFALRLASLAADLRRRAPSSSLQAGTFDHEALSVALTGMLGSYTDDADLSVHVRDLGTDTVLFDYYGDTPLIPASNQKLVTSAAALHLLGGDYTFVTTVGLVDKTLYVRGEGDPSLDLDELTAIANTLSETVDLAAVERLVVDDSAFSPQRFGPGYAADGPGYSYQAPSGALSLEFNTVEITAYPIRGTRTLGVKLSVVGDHVDVENHSRIGRRNTLSVTTRPKEDRTVVTVRGTLPRATRSQTVRRRIYDPGLFTGSALAQLLAEATASQPLPVERGVMPPDVDVLSRTESEPLLEVLDAGLAYSNNFIAEQVLRTLAWRTTGDPGDWDAGQQILHDYWGALVGDSDGFVAENGSGLTRTGRATTEGLVDLLALSARAQRRDGETTTEPGLLDALPVAGEPGTMRTRLSRSGKRVRAKTGTLNGVSGLTGIITDDVGQPQVGFSILINALDPSLTAPKRRRIEDQVVNAVLVALDDYAAGEPETGA